jgi:L-ectoine synthase
MIVRRLEDVVGTDREVDAPTWTSRRLLLAGDGMGFSFHDTVIKTATTTHIHYRHHLEAVYCVGGEGWLEVVATGERIPLSAGTMYALDRHDEHHLHAERELRMICVFTPPLVGDEVHDADGVYPAATGQ